MLRVCMHCSICNTSRLVERYTLKTHIKVRLDNINVLFVVHGATTNRRIFYAVVGYLYPERLKPLTIVFYALLCDTRFCRLLGVYVTK